jgi:hypothetical protein
MSAEEMDEMFKKLRAVSNKKEKKKSVKKLLIRQVTA